VRASHGLAGPPGPGRVAVDVAGGLVVRAPRPGDRVAIDGGRAAVGRLLAQGGVPSRLRHRVPVVATADRVVWVAGHRAAADLLAPPGAPAIVLEWSPT
jgi:tRNA(Ile)-lysidine synthase